MDLGLSHRRASQIDLPVKDVEIGALLAQLIVFEFSLTGRQLAGDLKRLDLERVLEVLSLGFQVLEFGLEPLLALKIRLDLLEGGRDILEKSLRGQDPQGHARFWPSGACRIALAPEQAFAFGPIFVNRPRLLGLGERKLGLSLFVPFKDGQQLTRGDFRALTNLDPLDPRPGPRPDDDQAGERLEAG